MTTSLPPANYSLTLFGAYTLELHLVVLLAMVTAAMVIDIREHRIPNWLVAGGMLFAFSHHALAPGGQGWGYTLGGLAVGMCALMPLYALRTMGAGDVKLMGMAGAFLGASATISAVLATFIAGGVLALLASAQKRMLPQLAANLRSMLVQRDLHLFAPTIAGATGSVGKMPYAMAIAAGTAIEVFWMRT
ncbi:A24 family peptidase [Massilia soli]|uniref:A24 family peptidase n=1 Tax=Massilia soli TaxID=2792854 RepID=A0ABS7SRI2_9BURK|nr:A24 family peptidase [Massilia soli]MBZ2208546.1 A24 family peptidase [Massilia soli]